MPRLIGQQLTQQEFDRLKNPIAVSHVSIEPTRESKAVVAVEHSHHIEGVRAKRRPPPRMSCFKHYNATDYPDGDSDIVLASTYTDLKFNDLVLVVWRKKGSFY